VNSPEFIHGDLDTGLLERSFVGKQPPISKDRRDAAIIAAVITAHEEARRLKPATGQTGAGMDPWRLLGRPGALNRGR
jgi:hypothetical protein